MSLNTIVIFYVIIGILALISIFFSIANWIKLNKINLEINKLQIAIGKKIKEFNFKKTEKIEANKKQNVQPMAHQTTSNTFVHNPDNQPHIEIVRNVRQEFSPYNSQYSSGHTQQSEQMPQQSSASSERTNKGEYYNKKNGIDKDREEILDIVGQSNPNKHIKFGNNENMTVVLYSDYTKDADFKNLWNEINNALVSTSIQTVNIDFKQILFLYDKEIEYLETISKTVHSQKKYLFFINCNPELRQIIQKNNILKYLIKETQNSQ